MSLVPRKESFLDASIKSFYEQEAIENEKDKVYLEMAVAWANIWVYLIFKNYITQQVEQQETYIKMEVTNQWGECEFLIDRDKYKFIVFAKDGRTMNLITGEPHEES